MFESWANNAWKTGLGGKGIQHTGLPVVVDGAGLRRRFVPAFQLQVLVLQPDLGKRLVDVHRRLPGAVAGRVLLTPVALVQGTCM